MSMANTVTSAMGSGAGDAAGSSVRMRSRKTQASPACARYPSSAPMATATTANNVNSMTEIASTKPCEAPMHFINATASMWRGAYRLAAHPAPPPARRLGRQQVFAEIRYCRRRTREQGRVGHTAAGLNQLGRCEVVEVQKRGRGEIHETRALVGAVTEHLSHSKRGRADPQ